MEPLLVGLAGCTGLDVIPILHKKRQEVIGYRARIQGIRAETHPMVLTDVVVEHYVTGRHVDPAAVAWAIELSESQ
jgi:putative redox protein